MPAAEASYGAVTRIRTACGIVTAVVAGSLWLLPAATAQSTEPSPELKKLWDQYPLAPPATQPSVRPETPVKEPPSPPAPPPAEDGDGSAGWIALGGVGAVVALLAAGGLTARSRRRPATATAQSGTPDDLIARAHALATEAAECDKFLHGQRHEGITVMTETADHELPATTTDVPSQPIASSYADIGERVAGVLAAAETAATQIREDARANADDVLSIARDEAEALRREAAAYDADTRAAVESYASDRRREVDEEVQKQFAESETQARATRQAAEAMARQIEDDARQYGQALRDESRAVEERLKKAAQGLRGMTREIEQLLGAAAGEGESLTDALRPYSQHPEMPVSASPNEDR